MAQAQGISIYLNYLYRRLSIFNRQKVGDINSDKEQPTYMSSDVYCLLVCNPVGYCPAVVFTFKPPSLQSTRN